jgi:hypothetical protein
VRRVVLLALLAACRSRGGGEDFRATPAANARVELCAAYPFSPRSGAVVIQRDGTPGDVFQFEGHPYNVHKDDCLALAGPELREIGWYPEPDGRTSVVLHLGGELADRLESRTEHRMSQFDATFVGGSLWTISLHEHVMSEAIALSSPDRDKQRALFKQLTGVEPPR